MNAVSEPVAQPSVDVPAQAATRRILVVDDEESIRELFMGLFPPPIYQTQVAANGDIAMALARENVYDLAYVDIMMPGIDGITTSKKLREVQPGLKTVLISGYLIEDRARAVEEAGAQAFLAKPFSVVAVRSLAERLLNGNGPVR